MKRNNPEILAPAGAMESLRAAVRCGADAVYLGQKQFSARRNAENFDHGSLCEAVQYCHLNGVKVYLALNTVIFDREMDSFRQAVKDAADACVDAVIVQDMGAMRALKTWCPEMPLHASTQMTVHTPAGAELMRSLGFKRIVLARELSARQIADITSRVGIETELFVHGALCMSVSGQCYMSALIGGRSGNKGSCAGTCRLPFSVAGSENPHALSLKDYCLADNFKQVAKLGVTSLKIEGRMKRPEYVAAAVSAYRAVRAGELAELETLRAVFSRDGFTGGYLNGNAGNSMFGARGRADVVAATDDILAALRETYRKERAHIPLTLSFVLHENTPARLTVSANGKQAEAVGPVPEPARTRSLTADDIAVSLGKLGGTVFYPADIHCEVGEGLMVPRSQINAMRRDAVGVLTDKLSACRPIVCCGRILPRSSDVRIPERPALRARFARVGQIPYQLLSAFEAVYLPAQEVLDQQQILSKYRNQIILEPDRVMFGSEEEQRSLLLRLRQMGFFKLAVSNPAHIKMGKEIGYSLYGTAFLNVTNTQSAEEYHDLGLRDLQMSFEAGMKDINRMGRPLPAGILAYGHLPMMIVKNCPLKQGTSCRECSGSGFITDRMDVKLPVFCTQRRYSEIFNSVPLNLSDRLKEFQRLHFAVLYFTAETVEEAAVVTQSFLAGKKPEGTFTRGLYFRGIE